MSCSNSRLSTLCASIAIGAVSLGLVGCDQKGGGNYGAGVGQKQSVPGQVKTKVDSTVKGIENQQKELGDLADQVGKPERPATPKPAAPAPPTSPADPK
jgi:hypothetical protein